MEIFEAEKSFFFLLFAASDVHYNEWIEVFINTNFELSTPDKTVKVSDRQQHGTAQKRANAETRQLLAVGKGAN